MSEAHLEVHGESGTLVGARARARMLSGMPFRERRLRIAGISTALLEAGEGPPMVLLHGPGEFAANWMRVIPELAQMHRVIAPDLPGHAASPADPDSLSGELVIRWLQELIDTTCGTPPVVVGHVLGGALAARLAIASPKRVARLVLVDTLGLAPFRPSPAFALRYLHFVARPGPWTYDRFMRQCSYDLDRLRRDLGERWDPFAEYAIQLARSEAGRAAGKLMREVGLPVLDASVLARLSLPVALIWGREDRANRVRVAQEASARFGWPLHVIDHCADDPARDRPAEFMAAMRAILAGESRHASASPSPAAAESGTEVVARAGAPAPERPVASVRRAP